MANDTSTAQKILDAAYVGDLEQVRQLAQTGTDLNALIGNETLLNRAVYDLSISKQQAAFAADMLRLLMQLGADPNLPGEDGLTALHTAMLKQNVELMRALLEGGAAPNGMSGCSQGDTLYDWAEEDYRYSTWYEPFHTGGSLYPPEPTMADDKANEDAWLLYLDRCAVKHGVRRPDYLFLLREFGARTAEELKGQ